MKILAISHAYTEAFTRVGLLKPSLYPDVNLVVAIPESVAINNNRGFQQLIFEGYKVITLKSIFNFHHSVRLYLFGLLSLLFKLKPDIVFVNNEPWSSTAFQIVLIKKIFRFKYKIVIYTCENQLRRYPWPFRWFCGYVLKNSDLIAAITKSEGAEVLKKIGFKNKICYIPLTVDTSLFKKRASASKDLQIFNTPEVFNIGYIGRLVKEKGVALLIEALKNLGKGFHLIIVGDGPEKNQLLKLAREYGLENRITFSGNIFTGKLPKYINCLDVLVLPSTTTKNWKEQFGRVLIEAMACEVPVIGSNSGEIPEVIGEAGLIFEEGNIEDLRAKIMRIKNDSALRIELALKGRQRTLDNYDISLIMQKTMNIYQGLLKDENIG